MRMGLFGLWFSLVFGLIGLGLCGCTSSSKSLREQKGTYLESVKLNYEAGQEAFAKKDFDKAISYYQFVKSKYPYSQYAALSDLRIADAYYAQEKWLEAADAYEIFIRLHPVHEEVAYASYREGLAYYHALPQDFFLLPKSRTRDQTYTEEALATFDRFLLQFPSSENAPDAREKRQALLERLADHNRYIAQYYRMRKRYEAAFLRFLRVTDLYPSTKASQKSFYDAALLAHGELNKPDYAIELLTKLVELYPQGSYVPKAQAKLQVWLKEQEKVKEKEQ